MGYCGFESLTGVRFGSGVELVFFGEGGLCDFLLAKEAVILLEALQSKVHATHQAKYEQDTRVK